MHSRLCVFPLNFHSLSTIEFHTGTRYHTRVPMTLEQIVEEARHWPPEKLSELVHRLADELRASDPDAESAWKQEIRRRLNEIENGTAEAVDGETVSARIRKIAGR